jgi:DNA repair protein RecO (recombination protein O)
VEWRDEGIVLGLRRLGESSLTLEAMTRGHGRHLGLVRGGRSTKFAAALQPGNTLSLVWRARLDEHLGLFQVEPIVLRAGRFLPSALALAGLSYLGALLRMLPERDPHEGLYEALILVVEALDDPRRAPPLLAVFETRLIAESGFALDLSECAATGAREDLVYVSPKSGRAVSAAAGEGWRDRLLPLPAFLRDASAGAPSQDDIAAAFRLTGHFLRRELFAPRGLDLPDSRRAFLAAAERAAK